LDSHPDVVDSLLKKNIEHLTTEALSKEEPDVVYPDPHPTSDQNIIDGSSNMEEYPFRIYPGYQSPLVSQ
jgi:hypothetical protein